MDTDPRDPNEDTWPDPEPSFEDDEPVALDPTEDPSSDQYIPAYRRQGSVLLGNQKPEDFPTLNSRAPQLRPRNDKRNPLLDEMAERNRQPKSRLSNLIR